MSYTGELLELKQPNSDTYDPLPLSWILEKSYKPTPNQRLDTSQSKRDLGGVLHRTTMNHEPSKVEFELTPMTNTQIATFNAFMKAHYVNPGQRMFTLRYYNVEDDGYKTGTFYMPDPAYTIDTIDYGNRIIKYNKTRIAFIEY